MLNQKESVFSAVEVVLNEAGRQVDGAVTLSKEERSQVVSMVTESITSGETEFSDAAKAKYDTPEKVRSYVVGLVNNWLRKDKRLNGGVKYQAKNPGSRAGSTDPVIKELRKLLSTLTEEDQKAAVQAEIDARLAEIQATKQAAKKEEINLDHIPEHLRALVG